jgi:hypothetical protein
MNLGAYVRMRQDIANRKDSSLVHALSAVHPLTIEASSSPGHDVDPLR